MKNDMMKAFEREIEEARTTGHSDFDYVFWDYCVEDASEEVLALCEAARKAHAAALKEWERKHPAEHAAELARAKAEYDAGEGAEIDSPDQREHPRRDRRAGEHSPLNKKVRHRE